MIKRVVLSTEAQVDLAALDRPVALRILHAVARFAATGAGNVRGLHGMHPPEFRLHAGDWRVRFHDHGDWPASSASATAATLTAELAPGIR